MSMHGRIYVEKNLTLERIRERKMGHHYQNLHEISRGKQSSINLNKNVKETTE